MTPTVRRTLAATVLGLVILAGLVWSFWPRAIAVEIVAVTRGPMRVDVSDEGRTRVREIYQLSAPVNGRLLRVEVHPGDMVDGGKTKVAELLPIAPSFLDIRTRAQAESAIKSAEDARNLAAAEVARAQAELAFAASDLKRATILVQSDAISRANLERAQLAYKTAAAQLATAQAALKVKDHDLQTARALLIDPTGTAGRNLQAGIPIIAPVSGRVLRVLHESESALATGTPILEIGDPQKLEIVAELISEDAVKVRVGDSATITDWGGTGILNARVRRVEPSGFAKISALGVEEQRVNVLLDFTDAPEKWITIADSFRVVAHITVWQRASVLRVPSSAMFRHGDGWAVFAARDGRALLTPIRIGRSNDEVAEVLGGLRDGDHVIAHPSDRIANNARVTTRTP